MDRRKRQLRGGITNSTFLHVVFPVLIATMTLLSSGAGAVSASTLGPADVLILVNQNSPVSRSVADHYRRHYPGITTAQVLYLSGLPDSASLSAGPADEIITREQFETLIAQPVRDYLVGNDMVDTVYCIITTAGMPYRVEDTDPALANVIMPAASNATLVVDNLDVVNAVSVESELALLFQIDPALDALSRAPLASRIVNPYQAYRSGIKDWAANRDVLGRRSTFRWSYIWRLQKSPKIEGDFDYAGYSARNRRMSPADIYLVARLDGPRPQGKYPIFAVTDMLRRSAWVSNSSAPGFTGYNAATSNVVIDETKQCASGCTPELALTKVLNCPPLPGGVQILSFADFPVPPGSEASTGGFHGANHYERGFTWLTGEGPVYNSVVTRPISVGLGGTLVGDDTNQIMNSSFLAAGTWLMGLVTYGCNGQDGRPPRYLHQSGPGGGPLFVCNPGAVFSSIESFNAVTMFTDVSTVQAKIAEFIEIGGSGAIGHAFEPEVSALIQADYLLRNVLRDEDGNGIADLTWVEAAFTAMPYLSWAEVVIGDPLMRPRVGPGGMVHPEGCPADVDGNRLVNTSDVARVLATVNSRIGESRYDPRADINRDGRITSNDIALLLPYVNTYCYQN